MNVKLIAAAIAALGLAACAPDVTPEATSAPAQPAAEKLAAQPAQPATAQAEQNEGAAAVAAKTEDAGKKED